jgi:hypothetical protein
MNRVWRINDPKFRSIFKLNVEIHLPPRHAAISAANHPAFEGGDLGNEGIVKLP